MDWITTIVSVPAILAAVNIFKTYGLPVKWAPVVSVALGAVFGFVAHVVQHGTFMDPQGAILVGIVVGLSASGIYDVSKTVHSDVVVEGVIVPGGVSDEPHGEGDFDGEGYEEEYNEPQDVYPLNEEQKT